MVSAWPHLGIKSILFRNDSEISSGTVSYGVEGSSIDPFLAHAYAIQGKCDVTVSVLSTHYCRLSIFNNRTEKF